MRDFLSARDNEAHNCSCLAEALILSVYKPSLGPLGLFNYSAILYINILLVCVYVHYTFSVGTEALSDPCDQRQQSSLFMPVMLPTGSDTL